MYLKNDLKMTNDSKSLAIYSIIAPDCLISEN